MTSQHGQKQPISGESTPPAERFANKDDVLSMLTAKSKQRSACQSLFSPPGKVTPANPEFPDNNLEVQSADYMKSFSGVKYELMVAGHIFLNEHVPKDYVTKHWKMIVDNNILVEKKALTEQNVGFILWDISKHFPEFVSEDTVSAIAKICCMLCRFTCVNCINFSEVGNHNLILSGHFNYPLQ